MEMEDDNEETSPAPPMEEEQNTSAPPMEEKRNDPVDEETHALKSYENEGPKGGCRQCWCVLFV